MEESFGQQAVISIIAHLLFIIITWWALQGINIEKLIKPGKSGHAKVLLILLTIAIGTTVSNFFLDYLFWSQQIQYLF